MKLSTFTIVLAGLVSSIVALPLNQGSEADVLAVRDTGIALKPRAAGAKPGAAGKPAAGKPAGGKPAAGGSSSDGTTPPAPPNAADAGKVQVWLRLNTAMMNIAPKKEGHNDHAQLIRNTKDAGGQHTDVVVGNPTSGFFAYGLEFASDDWVKKNNNGNGAETHVYSEKAKPVDGGPVTWTYKGVVKDGRVKRGDSPSIETKAQSLKGKPYDVNSWNCRAFADAFVKMLI